MYIPETEALRPRSFRRDSVAWLLFIVMTVVAGLSWYKFSHRVYAISALPAAADTATPRITILSFDRIVSEPDGAHVSKEQLRERLSALRADGFTTISVAQLEAFYHDARPLPEKPLLLLFEHGYMETYRNVDPLLRDFGWHASLGVQTRRLQDRDTAFVYWDRLQRMVDSGLWDIVAQGHRTDQPIVAGSNASLGNFLASRAWLENTRRLESTSEFSNRIDEDLATSLESFANNLERYHVSAFSYPFGKLDHLTDDVNLRSLVETAVSHHFKLSLVDDLFGMNDEFSSPQHLKRLRVTPALSATELTGRLDRALHSSASLAAEQQSWITGSGQFERHGTSLSLHGSPSAEAWLAGSPWESDWKVQADISLQQGEFWLVSTGVESRTQWRFGGRHGSGTLQLQSIDTSRNTTTLATFPVVIDATETHHLAITKRGAGVWIEWDHAPLTQRPVYIAAETRSLLGWKTSAGTGSVELHIDHFAFTAYPYTVAELSNDPSSAEIQDLIVRAPLVAAITFPWASIDTGKLKTEAPVDVVFDILARRYGWDLLPTVSVFESHRATREQIINALQTAIVQSKHGIFLRADSSLNDELAASIQATQRQAARQNKRLVLAAQPNRQFNTASAAPQSPLLSR
ncbi:MAG: polysaccharide deacetylase family protein [Gammaproteobacteria bacterium]|nr:polysaccharide deacetylase family protein [Gammaproteobacteria bacterium]